MKKLSLLFLSTCLLVNFQSFSQKKASLPPEFSIKKSETEAHMRFLAADELLGRRTGEQGNLVAARYIAEQFRKLGVVPVPGNIASGTSTYYQNVPFEKMGASGGGEITAGDEKLKSGEDWILMNGEATDVTAPLVYAGFGLENAAKGWDDYKGLDVKGKIVLVQSGTPDVQTPSEIVASSTEKRKLAT